MHDGNGLLAPGQCLHARGAQAFADVVGQLLRAFRQAQGHAASEMLGIAFVRWRVAVVVHSLIPLAFNALLRAWMARKQWVLTLPSEQPMAAAVSATSISSQ
jgi:hypothetical protein